MFAFASRPFVSRLAPLGLALAALSAGPAAAEGYVMDRYAYVVGVGTHDVLNVRAWPAAGSRKVAAIPHYGDGFYVQRCIVRPNGSSSDWCKVHHAGTWGWVNKRFLAFY